MVWKPRNEFLPYTLGPSCNVDIFLELLRLLLMDSNVLDALVFYQSLCPGKKRGGTCVIAPTLFSMWFDQFVRYLCTMNKPWVSVLCLLGMNECRYAEINSAWSAFDIRLWSVDSVSDVNKKIYNVFWTCKNYKKFNIHNQVTYN